MKKNGSFKLNITTIIVLLTIFIFIALIGSLVFSEFLPTEPNNYGNIILSINNDTSISGTLELPKGLNASNLSLAIRDSAFTLLDYSIFRNFKNIPSDINIKSNNLIVSIKLNPNCKLFEINGSTDERKCFATKYNYISECTVKSTTDAKTSNESKIAKSVQTNINLFLKGEPNQLYTKSYEENTYYVYEGNYTFNVVK